MKTMFVLMILFATEVASGAFEKNLQGGRSAGMGAAHVAIPGNPWGAFSNPGSLAGIQDRTLSISFSPQPFGLRELSHGALAYVEPTGIGVFAISASRLGYELYREMVLSLSYSHALEDRVKFGANLNYYSLTIQRYGSDKTFGLDIGFLFSLTNDVHWGVSASNVSGASIGRGKERLPQVYSTGVAYQPIPGGLLIFEVVKDIRYEAELRFGVEYALFDVMQLRAGGTTEPTTLNAGVGIRYSPVQLDYAFSSHLDLGVTHQLSISINLGDF